MKNKLYVLLSFFLVVLITISIVQIYLPNQKVEAAISDKSPHYPSVKTTYWISGDQTNLDYIASHYDWVDGATPPIANWLAKNSSAKYDLYYHWHILNLIDDGSGASHAKQTHNWYSKAVTNNLNWEDGFLHLGIEDTPVKLDNDSISDSTTSRGNYIDSMIRYAFRNNGTNNYGDKLWKGESDQSLAANNDMLSFGRLDKFDELNIEYAATPPSGWKGVLEYSTGQGSWTTLGTTSDTTSGLIRTIKFTPPSDWKRTKVNAEPTLWGNDGVYFVRLKNDSTSGPTIRKAQGRHYWVHNYTSNNNKIPAWDPDNDDNNDGYVSDAELAAPENNSAATAHFKYESRLPGKWAWSQFGAKISNDQIRQVFVDSTLIDLNNRAVSGRYVGARLDDMDGDPNVPKEVRDIGRVLEYPGLSGDSVINQWRNDYEPMLVLGRDTLHTNNYQIGGNVCRTGIDQFSKYFDFHMREDARATSSGGASKSAAPGFNGSWESTVWPTDSQWTKWSDLGKPMLWQWQLGGIYYQLGENGKQVTLTKGSVAVTGSGTQWLTTIEPGTIFAVGSYFIEVASIQSNTQLTITTPWANNTTSTSGYAFTSRDKYLGLAAFMAIQNPENDYFSEWFQESYRGDKAQYLNWVPAVVNDYGKPTGNKYGKESRGTRGAFLLQTGADSTSPKTSGGYYNYMVYGRDYDKALVVFRPTTKYDASYGSNSAVDITLPAGDTYYLVKHDGSTSTAPVANNKISLRNAEGAILMKGSQLGFNFKKSAEPLIQAPGKTVTYTIEYNNASQTDTVTNAKIEDSIPDGASYVLGSAKLDDVIKKDACSPTDNDEFCFANNTATWNLGSLSPGESGKVSFQVKINE